MIELIARIAAKVRQAEAEMVAFAEEGGHVSLFFPADLSHLFWTQERTMYVLVVNPETTAAGVQVLCFDYERKVNDFPTQFIIELTVEEYLDYQNGDLALPADWNIEVPLRFS